MPRERNRIAVVGGGAAGFFAAIHSAARLPDARVTIFEAGRRTLEKVRISGGGRCNVTHACFDPAELTRYYPRGDRALRGPFTRFGPADTIAWFEARGVPLKTEADGRVFPLSDDSADIVDCLRNAARKAGVAVRTATPIAAIRTGPDEATAGQSATPSFLLETRTETDFACDRLLLATGGAPAGMRLAASLGHSLVAPVPSLFTFQVADPALRALAGVSAASVRLFLPAYKKRESTGSLLFTHSGLSGPAVLRLSSFAAREFAEQKYRLRLGISWLPAENEEGLRRRLDTVRARDGARLVRGAAGQFGLPRRLWRYLCDRIALPEATTWSQLSGAQGRNLIETLLRTELQIAGKATFKEEFVTCGGVDLKQVDFRRMASRLVPGLFFAGEILDVDALTGGFNFQNAWTTGHIAGESLAASLNKLQF